MNDNKFDDLCKDLNSGIVCDCSVVKRKNMKFILEIVQIVLAILLILSILLQQRGSGIGLAFGNEMSVYRSKRGIENVLHFSTIVIAVLFCGVALVVMFLS